MTSESHFPDGVWTVITLRSGAQLRTLLSRCEVGRDEHGHITSIQLTTHPDSPTRIRELNARSVDAIHESERLARPFTVDTDH